MTEQGSSSAEPDDGWDNMQEPSPPSLLDRWKSASVWTKISLGALAVFAVLIVASQGSSDSKDDEPSGSYQACEAAARRNGIDPSGSEGLAAIGRCMAALDSDTTTEVPSGGSEALSTSEACAAFYRIVADVTMTDEQSAAAFSSLAVRTEGLGLAAEISAVAQGFANNDPAVSSERVNAICR